MHTSLFKSLNFTVIRRVGAGLAFAAALNLVACNSPDQAKVVSRGDGNKQNGREKITPETGVGIPALSAAGFLALRQVSRALNLAIQGEKSTDREGCQTIEIAPTGTANVETLTVINNSSCRVWSGAETFEITYANEKRDDTKQITQITKLRKDSVPGLILHSTVKGYDQEILLRESIKITSTGVKNIYAFSYNDDGFTEAGMSVSYEKSGRSGRVSPGVKNPNETEEQKLQRENAEREMDRLSRRSGTNVRGGRLVDGSQDEGFSNDERRRERDSRQRDRDQRRERYPDRHKHKNDFTVLVSGTIDATGEIWKWQIADFYVHLNHIGSNNQLFSKTELELKQKTAGEQLLLTECSLPIGEFLSIERIELPNQDLPLMQDILLKVEANGKISVPNYKFDLVLPKCSPKGYATITNALGGANSLLLKTPIYQSGSRRGNSTYSNRRRFTSGSGSNTDAKKGDKDKNKKSPADPGATKNGQPAAKSNTAKK